MTVRHCPNPDCKHRKNVGRPPEFSGDVQLCTDCGTTLLEGPAAVEGPAPHFAGKRILLSFLPLGWLWSLEQIPLPGIQTSDYEPTDVGHLGMLGLTPIIWAYVIVELLAVFLWRQQRLDPLGRPGLERATWLLAACFALFQGRMIALTTMDLTLVPILYAPTILWPLTLMAVTLLHGLLIRWLNTWALGSGFALFIFWDLVRALLQHPSNLDPAQDISVDTFQAIVFVGGVALWCFLAWRCAHQKTLFRAPMSGLWPYHFAVFLLVLPATFYPFFEEVSPLGPILGTLADNLTAGTHAYRLGLSILTLGLAAPLAYFFQKPGWQRQLLPTAAVLVPLVLVDAAWDAWVFWAPPGIGIFILATLASDFWLEIKARAAEATLVPVAALQQVGDVQPCLDALGRAQIFAFPQALAYRTLLQFFGPYVPVNLWVPAHQAEQAQIIVRETLAPNPSH